MKMMDENAEPFASMYKFVGTKKFIYILNISEIKWNFSELELKF